MFTKLRKRIAKVATGLMVLQLAVFGLNPATAFAAINSTTIAGWNFPTEAVFADSGIAANLAAEVSAVGLGAIDYVENGSTYAISANDWDQGDYWTTTISTLGYENLTLTSSQRSSATGPRDFQIEYRVGDGEWQPVLESDYSLGSVVWDKTSVAGLVLPDAINNKSDVSIRWVLISDDAANGEEIGSNGTNRIDDIVVSGTEIVATEDIVGPVITVPSNLESVNVDETGTAIVEYEVMAVDAVDGVVPVTCTPASGTAFKPGVTIVDCIAADSTGNISNQVFDVVVLNREAPELTTTLPEKVKNGNIYDFTVSLNNQFGPAIKSGVVKFKINDAKVDEIRSLKYLVGLDKENPTNWLSLPFEQVGQDLVGYFGPSSGFPVEIGYNRTTEFKVEFNAPVDRNYVTTLTLLDLEKEEEVTSILENVYVDGTAPKATITTEPNYLTDLTKPVSLTFEANENIQVKNTTFSKEGEQLLLFDLFSIKDSSVLEKIKVGTLKGNAGLPEGTYAIAVEAIVEDEVGNLSKVTGTINVDTVAPKAVGGFSGQLDANGNVVLVWTLPEANDYAKIVVKRNGEVLATLDPTTTTFTDANVTVGNNYDYEVVAYDAAGNFTSVTPASVNVPRPVVASASPVVRAPKTTDKPAEAAPAEQEVKAESTENNKEEIKNQDFPIWGIILLVLLAGVGGYLFLTQKPIEEPVRITATPIKPVKSSKPKKINKKK